MDAWLIFNFTKVSQVYVLYTIQRGKSDILYYEGNSDLNSTTLHLSSIIDQRGSRIDNVLAFWDWHYKMIVENRSRVTTIYGNIA